MAEHYVCLQPEYMNQFQCDGKSCQGACCKVWKISIDPVTWKKYSRMKLKSARKTILSRMKKSKDGMYYVKLRPDGTCPFLQKDFLCRLQRDYGETYLSAVCRTYPRTINIIHGMMERSLTLTCPVAAKLVLLAREPITFEQTEIVVDEPMTTRFPTESAYLDYLPQIQYAGISLLQDRRFSIDQRLLLLGFFLEQVQELEDMERLDDLVRLYVSDEVAVHAPGMFRAISFQRDAYLKTMFRVIETLYGEKSELHIWDECLNYVTEVFGFTEESYEVSLNQLADAYEKSYPEARTKLLGQYGHMLENYLVSEFFSNVYPCRLAGSLTQNFAVFLLGYKMMEFLSLAMVAGCDTELQEDALLGFMMSFAVKIDHSAAYMDCVAKEAMAWDPGVADVLKMLVQV